MLLARFGVLWFEDRELSIQFSIWSMQRGTSNMNDGVYLSANNSPHMEGTVLFPLYLWIWRLTISSRWNVPQVSPLVVLTAFRTGQGLVPLVDFFLWCGDIAVQGQQRSERNGNLPAVFASRAWKHCLWVESEHISFGIWVPRSGVTVKLRGEREEG